MLLKLLTQDVYNLLWQVKRLDTTFGQFTLLYIVSTYYMFSIDHLSHVKYNLDTYYLNQLIGKQ